MKTLEIYDVTDFCDDIDHDNDEVYKFIRMCPNLERLRTKNFYNILDTISCYNHKLSELALHTITGHISSNILIESLKHLSIFGEADGVCLQSLIQKCPRLEVLESKVFCPNPMTSDTMQLQAQNFKPDFETP